jgi:BMFP domain-containing protein YqiC
MAKSSAHELFSTLKGYINQLSDGERTPSEVASAFNDWARESAETVKSKVAEEVEASVTRMGFVKQEEFESLLKRVEALEKTLASGGAQKLSAQRGVRSVLRKKTDSKLTTKKKVEK